ncbi:hypothetical protein WJT86_08720 [Microvirga sp. W0021]|uniref:Uncharacterized protein n=1 Tax=Hohaiivirga grylli TaxID=3133970 RepID=A0ABV0BJR1_9HYPH
MTVPIQFITVRDQDGVIAIGRDDLVRYTGPDQIVASALCLRLFARAFSDLSPEAPPHRNDIRVLVAFPGDGILDCVEMITRARTRNRLVIDTEAGPPEAPLSVAGRFYFEIAIGKKAMGYWLAKGFFTDSFIEQIKRHQDGTGSTQELADYQIAKHALIGRLLGAPDEQLFHAREVTI